MYIRWAKRGDYDACCVISKNFKDTKYFKYCSMKWGWGEHKLLVAEEDGKIWGFQHMNVCRNRRWTNMYFTCVHPDRHGEGIGGMLFDKVIKLSVAAGKEEIRFKITDWNEQAIKFYKGFGLYPVSAVESYYTPDNVDYVYRVSLRTGKCCLDDFVRLKTRAARTENKSELLQRLKAHRSKGIYTMFGRPDLSKKWEKKKFATFWGTNMAGKSTTPKQLIAGSKFIEAYDPYFTLLDNGVVVVACYPADIRAGGMDVLLRVSFRYAMRLVQELWRMEDIRVLVAEGMLVQARAGIIRRYTENYNIFPRDVIVFQCKCGLDTIDARLFASKGKHLMDYKGDGVHIKRLVTENARILGGVDREIFDVREFDTENRSIEEMAQEVREVLDI